MSLDNPIITVLLPIYNGENYLPKAIESILNQTYNNFELLIIDDCSTDDSVQIIKSFNDPRIRLIKNDKNVGQSETLNKGLNHAKGTYIARMDQDDVSLPERLEKQVQYFFNNSNISVLGTFWKNIDENDNNINNVQLPVEPFECAFWTFASGEQSVGHPCVMFKQSEIKRLGGYSSRYKIALDSDLWFRCLSQGFHFANVPEVLLSYRMHNKQGSKKPQTDVEHNSALSTFLSEQLSQHIEPDIAALIRPNNFNGNYFHSEKQIEEMFRLKKRSLEIFFNKYKLLPIEIVRCCITLWESLFPLRKLKIVSQLTMIINNTGFCCNLIQTQLKKNNVFYIPYLIIFFYNLPKFLLIKTFQKFANVTRKILGKGITAKF